MDENNAELTAHSHVWQGYILHDNLNRESHKAYGPPTLLT